MSYIDLFGFEKKEAEKILKELEKYKTGIVKKIDRKTSKVPPPLLHSLTSLQREANKLYGFSAKKTLDVAQKLYETYKVISYPSFLRFISSSFFSHSAVSSGEEAFDVFNFSISSLPFSVGIRTFPFLVMYPLSFRVSII